MKNRILIYGIFISIVIHFIFLSNIRFNISNNKLLDIQLVQLPPEISKDDLSKVFEPYYTTTASGNGIGMMIVHRIMRDHGGDVGIDSKVGAGTIVTLRFPRNSERSKLLESNPAADTK